MQDLSTCDISNSVTIRGSDADSGYINTRGTLRIDSIKPNSAGASLVLVGKGLFIQKVKVQDLHMQILYLKTKQTQAWSRMEMKKYME